jgi:hypothetical protein
VFRVAAALQVALLTVYLTLGHKTRSSVAVVADPYSKPKTWSPTTLFLLENNNNNNSKNNNKMIDQKDSLEKKDEDGNQESAMALLSRVSRSSIFWGMMLGKASLLGVGQMIGFFALYLETGLGMSPSAASSWSGLFAVGSLIASLLGSRFYQGFGESTRRRTIVGANVVGISIPLLLWSHAVKAFDVTSALPTPLVLVLLTLWGSAWALAFYIPPGVIALAIGGRNHAAFITNLADGFGFAVAAVFSIFAMNQGREGGKAWGPIMLTLSTFAGIALVSLRHAMQSGQGASASASTRVSGEKSK